MLAKSEDLRHVISNVIQPRKQFAQTMTPLNNSLLQKFPSLKLEKSTMGQQLISQLHPEFWKLSSDAKSTLHITPSRGVTKAIEIEMKYHIYLRYRHKTHFLSDKGCSEKVASFEKNNTITDHVFGKFELIFFQKSQNRL